MEGAGLATITRRIAGEFLHARRSRDSAGTILREFSAYSGLWRWAVRRGYAEVNPWTDQTAGMKTPRGDEQELGQERAYSTPELVNLLRAGQAELAPRRGGYAATFWDVMRLALLTGARASELMGLRCGDVIEDGAALPSPRNAKAVRRKAQLESFLSTPSRNAFFGTALPCCPITHRMRRFGRRCQPLAETSGVPRSSPPGSQPFVAASSARVMRWTSIASGVRS